MQSESQTCYWVADSPSPDHARLSRYLAWDHHIGELHRRGFSLWARPSMEGPPVDVHLYSVRLRGLIDETRTLGAQGMTAGDVLILLPGNREHWLEYLASAGALFPANLPADLPVGTEWYPLSRLLAEKDRRDHNRAMEKHKADISNTTYELHHVGVIGAFGHKVSHVQVAGRDLNSSVPDKHLDDQLRALGEHVKRLAERLDDEAIEAAMLHLKELTEQAQQPPEGRDGAVIRRALGHLTGIAKGFAEIGAPIVEMAGQLKSILLPA